MDLQNLLYLTLHLIELKIVDDFHFIFEKYA